MLIKFISRIFETVIQNQQYSNAHLPHAHTQCDKHTHQMEGAYCSVLEK